MAERPHKSTSLDERHAREIGFHDDKYAGQPAQPFVYRFHPTYPIFQIMKERFGNIDGAHVLDMGCGDGWVTAELAAAGARVAAFDISPEAVASTLALLRHRHVETHCKVETMAAEKLEYPDAHFDIVCGFGILHHLDLVQSLAEVKRVLKPSGRAYFAEPLRGNPLIDLYRKLTPRFRTHDERPLDLSEFCNLAAPSFGVDHEEYYLTALIPLSLSALGFSHRVYAKIAPPFFRLDRALLTRRPSLGRLAWYSLITLRQVG